MLRRLHPDQPDAFAFTPANRAWAEAQIAKYPEGRQASAIIPLLWRAQEQEGWLTRAAIEHVAGLLDMAYIRALEVATFYFMFQLAPVGAVAHVQVCGTTPCMLCGAEELVAVCKARIAKRPHALSADGSFSWEEVECLGACANAPMVQIGKDYYEDLTAERLEWILDELAAGRVPPPGPQNGRFSSEPAGGLTSLSAEGAARLDCNASVERALAWGDTIRRIDGSEAAGPVPRPPKPTARGPELEPVPAAGKTIDDTGVAVQEPPVRATARPDPVAKGAEAHPGRKPALLAMARAGGPDALTRIEGVDAPVQTLLNALGVFHLDQIAGWDAEELAWIDAHLDGYRGRPAAEDWVGQARALLKDGETSG